MSENVERAARELVEAWKADYFGSPQDDGKLEARIRNLVATREREARRLALEEAMSLMRKRLVYDSQRAVSWHEVQDCLEALARAQEEP